MYVDYTSLLEVELPYEPYVRLMVGYLVGRSVSWSVSLNLKFYASNRELVYPAYEIIKSKV